MSIAPIRLLACGLLALYAGDGSERCLICGWRGAPSYYMGAAGVLTDDGLPVRFPCCDVEHGLLWVSHLIAVALEERQ